MKYFSYDGTGFLSGLVVDEMRGPDGFILNVQSGVATFEKVPAAPWNGEGLPPVGIEIEAMLPGLGSTTYFWQIAKVVHGSFPDSPGKVLVFSLETTRPGWVDEFRPIRSAEQIAEEERKSRIANLADELAGYSDRETCKTHMQLAEYLDDNGYRKQVTE